MSESRRQILEMLSAGKITAEEAERLISAFEKSESREKATDSSAEKPKSKPKYLRVLVESDESHQHGHHDHHGRGHHRHHHHGPTKVNVRIPMQLLRAGIKLTSLIPSQARDHVNEALHSHGIKADINQIKPEDLEELIDQLNEFSIDVDEKHNKVRIFCE